MNSIISGKNRITLGNSGNAVVLLVSANVVFYLALEFLKIFYFFISKSGVAADTIDLYDQQIFSYFILPASFTDFLHKPWTLITYMFCHESLLNLFSNVLWLAAFGFILQGLTGNKKIIPLYLYGGIFGGIFFLAVNAILPQQFHHAVSLVGATPAIIAVAAGAATLTPGYRIFPMLGGGIPLWILFAAYMVVNITVSSNAGMAYISTDLFAALTGFFIIYQLKKGNDYTAWMYSLVHKTNDLFNPDKKYAGQKAKHEIFYKSTRKPFETKEHLTQERIDELLDKINNKGYDSLTKAEKDFLQKASTQFDNSAI